MKNYTDLIKRFLGRTYQEISFSKWFTSMYMPWQKSKFDNPNSTFLYCLLKNSSYN